MSSRAEAAVDLSAIAANIKKLKATSGVELMAVVKADAYGHGLLESAAALRDQVDGFAVLELEAARQLRQHGCDAPILMLEGFHSPAELNVFDTLSLSTIIHRLDQIERQRLNPKCHLPPLC